MTIYPMQADFSRGELSPKLHARIDITHYKSSLYNCTNWTILRQGGLRKRSGFRMVKEVKDSSKATRLLPFVFSIKQAYVVEAGDLYARYFANGGLITVGGGSPSGITRANPAVVTLAAHGFSNGDRVYVTAVAGMVELNNREFTVANAAANTFELSGVDSSAYTAFTSGGMIRKIVETATPYSAADVADLDYAQTADVLTIAHQSHKPRELTRTADTVWTLSSPTFLDGPYLDEPVRNTVTVTPGATGGLTPKMTSNTLPSGTAADSGASANAYKVFDRDPTTYEQLGASSGWIEYTPTAPAVVDRYWIKCDAEQTFRAPASWRWQGYDGTNWVDLDVRNNESSWGGGETRFFEFENYTAYSKYRLNVSGTGGGGVVQIAEIGVGYNGDYAPTMTLTFSGTTNVNAGAGFTADDIGRHVRLYASDGKWRWFIITAVTSTLVIEGRMYGHALPNTNILTRWKMGAWRAGQWPGLVSFYQSRRVFARSDAEPQVLWLSKAFDFYDFGTSQPLADDDGMRLQVVSNKVNAFTWLAEGERLSLGTVGNIRVLDKANQNQGFGATNFDQRRQVATGSKKLKPVEIGSVLLYADYYGKAIREFVYDLNQDGYIAPDATILSDHLLAAGIVEMAYQATPDSVVWIVCTDGSLVTMTYERDQKVLGLTRAPVAPGDAGTQAYVESVCSIPGTGRDEVWIIVRRTVGGVTRRYVETLAPEFAGEDIAGAEFLDSCLTYDGAPTSVVAGLSHLAGLGVGALVDGVVYRGLSVSSTGLLTLPEGVTGSRIVVGLPYTASLTTLPLDERGQSDGVGISRRVILQDLRVSVVDSLGLKAKGLSSPTGFEVFTRTTDDPVGQMRPRTGVYPVYIDSSHQDDGQYTLYSDDPLPCLIRGVIFGADGEP